MPADIEPILEAPILLGQYDPKTAPPPALPGAGPTAVLVCHGMGQQVPFQTLDCIARAIVAAHQGHAEVVARLVQPGVEQSSMGRVEITLRDGAGGAAREIHLYEAYWAPLTEKAISFRRAAWFLIESGIRGLRACTRPTFQRWMFTGWKDLKLKGRTALLLAALLALALPLLALASLGALAWFVGLAMALAWHLKVVTLTLALLAYWKAMAAFRRFVVQYMGDVAIYVSSNEVNEFWKIRDEIKDIGMRAASVVYNALAPPAEGGATFAYGQVVVVGHSLGSVVAYDTLNALIKRDQAARLGLRAVQRTYALVTFGSPLDKTAFLFRQHVPGPSVVREVLAAAVQPMIQSYDFRPSWWINVYARVDIISGSLEYYDHPPDRHQDAPPPALPNPKRVRNVPDPVRTINPAAAHTGYWNREATRTVLYQAVTDALSARFDP
jgi:hypothetical protein